MRTVQVIQKVRDTVIGWLTGFQTPFGYGVSFLCLTEITNYLRPFHQLHSKLLDILRAFA